MPKKKKEPPAPVWCKFSKSSAIDFVIGAKKRLSNFAPHDDPFEQSIIDNPMTTTEALIEWRRLEERGIIKPAKSIENPDRDVYIIPEDRGPVVFDLIQNAEYMKRLSKEARENLMNLL